MTITNKHLAKANIVNLTNLWKAMGVDHQTIGDVSFYRSHAWPHRLWLDWDNPLNPEALDSIFNALDPTPKQSLVPIWHSVDTNLNNILQQYGATNSFQQVCMILDMSSLHKVDMIFSENLTFKTVTMPNDIDCWTQIASEAFGYIIDPNVIRHLSRNPDITLILAYHQGTPAGTTLLFDSGGVVGIHTMGVIPVYRRKGFAREIMNHVLNLISQSQSRYVTLQASTMGEPLYLELGFRAQFTMLTLGFS